MSDIEENAFQIARYMRDNNFTGANIVLGSTIREALNLSPEDFDAADDFLREMRFCDATSAGDSAQLVLKVGGVVFVTQKASERIDISRDAEQLARYLEMNQTWNKTIIVDTEMKADLQWDDKRYWQACQILIDEGLAEEKPKADNVRFKGLSLNAEGRKAVRHNFRRQTPAINLHTGDNISVESSGENTAIAAGRGASVNQSIRIAEIDNFFDEIIHQVEHQQGLSYDKKQEIKEVVELSQEEAKQNKPNEKRLAVYFQNIAMMAPDILEVAVAAASASIVGPLPVAILIAKKISEKAKADARKKI